MIDSNTPAATGGALAWEYDIPLLTSRFLWWDFLKVAGISSASLWVLVAGMGWLVGEPAILPPVIVPIAFGALMVLLALASLLLGSHYRSSFEVSSEGVAWAAGSRESKMNTFVTVAGAILGSPTTTGAGLLAKSSEAGLIEWSEVGRLRVHPGPRVISVMNSWRVVIRLHCPPELFDAVVALCEAEFAAAQAARIAEKAEAAADASLKAPARPLWSRIAWAVLCLALTAAMFAWGWMETGTETASRIALIGGVLVAVAAALEGPARRILGAFGAIGVSFQVWALTVSAFDTFTVPDYDPVRGAIREELFSATLDTPVLVLASMATLGLLIIALWRVLGRMR